MERNSFWQTGFVRWFIQIFRDDLSALQHKRFLHRILLLFCWYIPLLFWFYLPVFMLSVFWWFGSWVVEYFWAQAVSKEARSRRTERERLEFLQKSNQRLLDENGKLSAQVSALDKSQPSVLIAHIQATMNAFDKTIADINVNETLTPYLKAKRTANIEAVRDHLLAKYLEEI